MSTIATDIVILGGGIAGASLAGFLGGRRRAVLVERESQPGYHASGRSAALFSEAYGNAAVRALSVASRPFLENPPAGFAEHPLLGPRGALHVGGPEHAERLDALYAETRIQVPSMRRLLGDEVRALVPALRPAAASGGVLEPDARDIDTHAVLHGFLRRFRADGGKVLTGAEVEGLSRGGRGWIVETRAGQIEAEIVVDAGGAWADSLAALAGAAPLGLRPMRRTAFLFSPPPELDVRAWPLVIGAREDCYFKPDAGLLLGSLADETPSEPCDAQAEEIDVAVAVERIETLADLPVRRIVRRWAGLRTFAPDRTPVVGFAPDTPGFFWLAGQGGYGFQTAPALGRLAAALLCTGTIPADLADRGLTAEALGPGRFGARSATG